MQLLTEDGLLDIAADPSICHISQSHLFHAVHDAIDGPVAVDQIVHGTGEFLAGQLAPEYAGYSHQPLHDCHHPPSMALHIVPDTMVTAGAESLQRSRSQFVPLPTNCRETLVLEAVKAGSVVKIIELDVGLHFAANSAVAISARTYRSESPSPFCRRLLAGFELLPYARNGPHLFRR
ncbi:MAG: hypothetical protein ACLQO1_19595 [Steroidobacteraceae bacterium]